MKKSLFSFLFLGGLLSAAPVHVSYLNPGTPAVAVNGVYVGPYTLSINGVTTPAMCMDDFLEVGDGDKWTANKTAVTSSNFSGTYLGNGDKMVHGENYTSKQVYTAEAYLFSLITKPGADRADIQEAAWAIMDPGTLTNVINSNNTGVENYLEAAANNFSSFNSTGYSIISQTGGLHNCSKQEFMVASTPEPGTIGLFGGGVLLAGISRIFRRRKSVA